MSENNRTYVKALFGFDALMARATKHLERAGDSLRGEGRFSAAADLGNPTDAIEKPIALTGRNPRIA
jgi:hypothetical protein